MSPGIKIKWMVTSSSIENSCDREEGRFRKARRSVILIKCAGFPQFPSIKFFFCTWKYRKESELPVSVLIFRRRSFSGRNEICGKLLFFRGGCQHLLGAGRLDILRRARMKEHGKRGPLWDVALGQTTGNV
jgi:hypothetical protein